MSGNKKVSSFLLTIILVFLSLAKSYSATQWNTLESKHAIIYYPKTHYELAVESLYYLEKHHNKVAKLTGNTYKHKKQFLLQDIGMNTNGYANRFNHTLSIFTPAPSSHIGSLFHRNWIESVTIHEYFHSLHMYSLSEKNHKASSLIMNVNFHTFLPLYLIEGFAVYQESQLHPQQGRLNDGLYHATLMTKAKYKPLPKLSSVAYFQRHYPLGQWYLYGAGFTSYLAKTYGEETPS